MANGDLSFENSLGLTNWRPHLLPGKDEKSPITNHNSPILCLTTTGARTFHTVRSSAATRELVDIAARDFRVFRKVGSFPTWSLGHQSLNAVGYHLNDPQRQFRLLFLRNAEREELCDAKGEGKDD